MLHAIKIPGDILTSLTDAELAAWAAGTEAQHFMHRLMRLSQQYLSSLVGINSADEHFSCLLGSCSLS